CKNIISRQNEIRRWCVKSGLFSYVHPQYRTPLWIHAEVSTAPPSSLFVPYPALFPGNIGVYSFILQQCLNIIEYPCLINGRFCTDTEYALRQFQSGFDLLPTGFVDSTCWQRLLGAVSNMPKL
ncbi:MAG: peptidoglycan-binding protein, partial [Clostridia bacterium]|nr:peptidoglycan-binding protein [Clostridia bacterium]